MALPPALAAAVLLTKAMLDPARADAASAQNGAPKEGPPGEKEPPPHATKKQHPWMAHHSDPAAPRKRPLHGFIDFNNYYDTRQFLVLKLNVVAQLPHGMQYFSISEYFAPVDGDPPHDFTGVFSKQTLSWTPSEEVPLAVETQWVIQAPGTPDFWQLGVDWQVSQTPYLDVAFQFIHLSWSLAFFPLQLYTVGGFQDGWSFQLESVYRLDILPDLLDRRLYVGGFLDNNLWFFDSDREYTSQVVTQNEAGVRLIDEFYVIGSYRYDGYFPSKKSGWGAGLEYVVSFNVK